jgi:hypothetical protein
MTIRRTLRGWYRFLWVAMIMVGVLGGVWRDTGYNHAFRIGVLCLLLVSVFTLFAFGFRCPRCRTSLVSKAPTLLTTGGRFVCPRCGVSVDEQR